MQPIQPQNGPGSMASIIAAMLASKERELNRKRGLIGFGSAPPPQGPQGGGGGRGGGVGNLVGLIAGLL